MATASLCSSTDSHTSIPPPDLQTQLENAKQFGHSLKNIPLSPPQAPVTIQPQRTLSQSSQDLGLQPAIH